MKSLRQRISESASLAGVPFKSMTADEERTKLKSFFESLTTPKRGCWPIWQNGITPKCSFKVANAYVHIFRILLRQSEKEVYLLFENSEELGLFALSSPQDFLKLIEESDIFVYYVFTSDYRFAIGENDHDYLIGCGDAAPWVLEYAESTFSPSELEGMDFSFLP